MPGSVDAFERDRAAGEADDVDRRSRRQREDHAKADD
jgi:hypothetical protein